MITINHVAKPQVNKSSVPREIMELLAMPMQAEIISASQKMTVEEIRLRQGRHSSLVCDGKNIMLSTAIDKIELSEILKNMCGGSLYAYSDTINRGYISLPNGIRVGVCGRAASEGERVVGVYDISLLCIRIPHALRRVGMEICNILDKIDCGSGILIYSPPGVGKTTLLRGVASILASGENRKRVVMIDTRGELSAGLEHNELCLDVLSGYPRRAGVEIATRTLNAEIIICDEIGDIGEAIALVASHNSGIPLIASAHGKSFEQLIKRTGIKILHRAGIFGAYVGIKRDGGGSFIYDITYR